jgi:hypothetical protein
VQQSDFATTAAGGLSPAIALARTILLKRQSRVVLIIDSDSLVESDIARRGKLVNSALSAFDPGLYRLFIAIPAVEGWVFLDPNTSRRIIGDAKPKSLLEHAPRHPKQILRLILRRRYKRDDIPALQRFVNEEDLSRCGRHQPLSDLISFVRADQSDRNLRRHSAG